MCGSTQLCWGGLELDLTRLIRVMFIKASAKPRLNCITTCTQSKKNKT